MKLRTLITLTLLVVLSASCSVTKMIPTTYSSLPQEKGGCVGKLQSITYPTSIPGPAQRRLYAYLPEGYNGGEERYPVLYLLHGARGDEASWITQGGLLRSIDSLYSIGAIPKMIFVFPNMNSYDSEKDYSYARHKGGWESFFEVDGAVESSFVEDVVRGVDKQLRTIPRKDARAIAGLSLGGMQAIHISAASPETFGYVGVFSAPLKSALRKGPYSSFYSHLDENLKLQFGENPPYYAIYVGKKDIYRSTMEKFAERLRSKGHTCIFVLDEGGHQWPQWNSFVVDFLKGIF